MSVHAVDKWNIVRYLISAEQEKCWTLIEITDVKQNILYSFSSSDLLQVYFSTAIKKIMHRKSELEKTGTTYWQMFSTGVNKCENKLEWISGCWGFFCLFSHQLNCFTHFAVTQSKTELLDLSLRVKECTNLQTRNGCDTLWVKVCVSFILGKILMFEVECFLGNFVYTHTHLFLKH